MTVFELEAKLGLNKEGFDKGVRDAEGSGKGLKDSLSDSFGKIKTAAKAFLGAAIFKEIIDGVKSLISEVAEVGDTIDKQSQILGLSRKAYQEWDYILGQNGASIESLGASMRTLNSLFLSAKEGNEEANNTLAQLGVNIHELERMNPEQQFEALVRAFQKMPAGAQKSALAVKVFGRSGTQLLPLLNQSSDSIDELRKRAEELGLIMSDEAVDASVAYGDSLDDLKLTFNAFKYSIGAKLLPTLTGGIQKLTNYASKLRKAYEGKGFAGVIETLVGDLKAHWPTWEQIKTWVIEKWNGIIEGFKGIAKLVFGETEDGGIKWPTAKETWAKISETVSKWWGAIKEVAGGVLKLIFGEDENGGIKWPTPEEIKEGVKQGLRDMWEGIKTFAGTVMKLIFGEGEDGGIEWPTAEELWEKIKTGLSTLWGYIKGFAEGILQFIFGEDENGGIDWGSADKLWYKIGEGLRTLWKGIGEFAKNILVFVFGKDDNGGIKFPSAEDTYRAIGHALNAWWTGVKKLCKGVLNLLLGALGLPDVDETVRQIKAWWENIKKKIALKIFVEVGGYKGFGFDPSKGETWSEGVKKTNERFGIKPADLSQYDPSFFEDEHAKGSWSIPFDNYIAKLHRGEMVLTASRARKYRDREDSGFDMGALVMGIVGAVREGMDGAQVNSYLDSTRVTNKTNNVTGNRLMARRFAPI